MAPRWGYLGSMRPKKLPIDVVLLIKKGKENEKINQKRSVSEPRRVGWWDFFCLQRHYVKRVCLRFRAIFVQIKNVTNQKTALCRISVASRTGIISRKPVRCVVHCYCFDHSPTVHVTSDLYCVILHCRQMPHAIWTGWYLCVYPRL